MRFEIGVGGGLLIAAGLVTLSAGVFGLGLIAGYEMANQEQHNQEVAEVYPLPSPPPAVPTPPASFSSAVQVPASPTLATPSPLPIAKPATAARPRSAPAIPPPVAVAVPPEPPTAASSTPKAPTTARMKPSGPASRGAASIGSAPSPVRQPYSIQIDAVMDRQGADNMVKRLKEGGYEPYIVETQIDGKTWYRVRVGHYQSEAEAHEAEQRLRQDFSGSLPTR